MSADLSHLATPGAEIAVRVRPGARRNLVTLEGAQIRVTVTAAPQGGKANGEVQKLLAKSLGIAKSRLLLLRGHRGRDKLFRIAP